MVIGEHQPNVSPGKQLFFLLLIVIAGFFSYQKNVFGAAADWWFAVHSAMPTQIVLDGLLHAKETGQVVPGRYLRAEEGDPRALYAAGDTSGEFVRYDSQYGLQVRAFAALGFTQVAQMESLASALMALVVALLAWLVRRDFSIIAAGAVAALLILSPWVVIFARNVFWVPFTWFLPLTVAMYYSTRIYADTRVRWRMLALLYATLLVKLLCGYEFLTSIMIALCCPLLYQGLRQAVSLKRIVRLLVLVGGVSVAAFATAAFIHIGSIGETREAGFKTFIERAERRFYSEDPQATAAQACKGDAACEQVLLASLKASPVDVMRIYLVMPEFLPWLSTMHLTQEQRHAFRDRLQSQPSIAAKLAEIVAHPPIYWFFLLAKVLNPVAFMLFILAVTSVAARSDRPVQGLMALAFIAPVSWFVAAKGFSYIHDHLCFVVWYVPFILYGTVLLSERIRVSWRSRCDSNTRPSV